MSVEMIRPQRLAEEVVFVDGLSRSGKSLVAPVLSSFERSELWRLDHNFEYLCILDRLGQIDRRAAAMMVQLEADLELYNLMIGRNTNFRATDDSGVDVNLQTDRYRRRLAEEDGDRVTRLIRETKPILHIMIHWILPMSDLLWDALGDRLRLFVVVVRHPLWQIQGLYEGQWETRIGQDPRDFQPCYLRDGQLFPWSAADWDEEYHGLSRLERSIQHVAWYIRGCQEFVSHLSEEQQRKVIFIPFEPFTANPSPYLRQLTTSLSTRETELTARVLERMNVPRRHPDGYLTAKQGEFDRLLKAESASPKYTRLMHDLFDEYEAKHLSDLSTT